MPYTGDLLSVGLETERAVCQELQPLVEVYSEPMMNVWLALDLLPPSAVLPVFGNSRIGLEARR